MGKKPNNEQKKSIFGKAQEILNEKLAKGEKIDKETIEKALKVAGAVVLAGVAGATLISNIKDDNSTQIEEPTGIFEQDNTRKAVVRNENASLYRTLPTRSIVEKLDEDEVIIFTEGNTTDWKQVGENEEVEYTFINVDKVIQESEIKWDDTYATYAVIPENIDRAKEFGDTELFVLQDSIDTYVECDHDPELKFRRYPRGNVYLDKFKRLASDGTLYVCMNNRGYGDDGSYLEAILILDNGNIEHGYVCSRYIERKKDSTTRIGVTNEATYLRNCAEIPENENDVQGSIYNGRTIEIIEDADKFCYKCKIDGDDNIYYIKKNTVIPLDDFDYEVEYSVGSDEYIGAIYELADDGSFVEKIDSEGNVCQISNGEKLIVDIDRYKGKYYCVYDEEKGIVGFIEGDKLLEKYSGKLISEMKGKMPVDNERDSTTENQVISKSENEYVEDEDIDIC